MASTAAERKTAERARKRASGLKKYEVWCHPKDWPTVKLLIDKLAKWRSAK